MKLLTYDAGAGPRAGVLTHDRVVDAATLLRDVGQLRDVRALLEVPGDPLGRLRAALESGSAGAGHPLTGMRLRAPVLQPPTVRDFFAFEGHANAGGTRQLSEAWYRLPIFYFSNPLRIFGPDDAVPYPSFTFRRRQRSRARLEPEAEGVEQIGNPLMALPVRMQPVKGDEA